MNAVHALVAALPRDVVRERLAREELRTRARLVARWELDLIGFLNEASRRELAAMCAHARVEAGALGVMRLRLWRWGAAAERTALGLEPDARVQPTPLLRGARLQAARRVRAEREGVLPSARAAREAEAPRLPRPVPPPRAAGEPAAEPSTLDDLLARADALIGVRLGRRGRDKGAHGQRIADLLGLPRSSDAAPDWRGEVEVKSLAVVRAAGGRWRIKDGPALSMRGVDARAKLGRVLWIVRIDEGEVPDAPVLSWFYQELDATLARAFEEARHLRPKGGKATTAQGWYLRRDFFEACGLLRSLNG